MSSEDEELATIMTALETLCAQVPMAHLRCMVANGEANAGKMAGYLPSGISFDKHTLRGRLWLDFLDDLAELKKP